MDRTYLQPHTYPQSSSSTSTFQLTQPSFQHPTPTPGTMQSNVSPEEIDDIGEDAEENVYRDMSFDEILEDLNARFLVNLPKEETSLVRVYWQAEQA